MAIDFPEIGVCGLSCRLCPSYHSTGESRCGGCKSEARMKVGCPFITCAVKKRGIGFCGECLDAAQCERWRTHREKGRTRDSFVCYQHLEDNIAFAQSHGLAALDARESEKERLLAAMLAEFNEGRSKTFYCIAATVMEPREIEEAIADARGASAGAGLKDRSKALHAALEGIAKEKGYHLKLRK